MKLISFCSCKGTRARPRAYRLHQPGEQALPMMNGAVPCGIAPTGLLSSGAADGVSAAAPAPTSDTSKRIYPNLIGLEHSMSLPTFPRAPEQGSQDDRSVAPPSLEVGARPLRASPFGVAHRRSGSPGTPRKRVVPEGRRPSSLAKASTDNRTRSAFHRRDLGSPFGSLRFGPRPPT